MTHERAKPHRRRAPVPRYGRITGLVLVIAVTAAVVFLYYSDFTGFLFRRTVQSGSQGTLVELRDLDELETLAYVRRTVFPHDYLSADTDMTSIIQQLSAHGGTPESVLPPVELLHYRAANLAAEVGLATRREQTDYVVITVVYRFGYNTVDLARRYGEFASAGEDAHNIPIEDVIPEASILSVEIEDVQRDTYPYGTISLDAEGMRRVAAFVAGQDLPAAVLEELKRESRVQAVAIVRRLTARQ